MKTDPFMKPKLSRYYFAKRIYGLMNVLCILVIGFWYLFADDGKHGVITLRIDTKQRNLRNLNKLMKLTSINQFLNIREVKGILLFFWRSETIILNLKHEL